MITTIGGIYFSLCAVLCLVGALITVLAQNPIRGALGLLTTIIGIAGLFLQLNAQFLAAIQIIVYAGAVVVLFVFVLLLLGVDAHDPNGPGKSKLARSVGGVLMVALPVAAAVLLIPELAEHPMPLGQVSESHGSVSAVGSLLFSEGLVPFELSTALLIVSVVGAIAVARSHRNPRPKRHESNPTRRLYHGPVHPRDAGYPLAKGSEP
ncbi:MAG TPA: NADH-quinone oxidoreductase subunit J [Polyangiaceae bacterium]|nr:NADH-quinone oxidoreductase subunit J [Polyangiaceae bacterium]